MINFAKELPEIKKQNAVGNENQIELFIERYIYIQEGDCVCDLDMPADKCVLKINEFKNSTANINHFMGQETENVKVVPVSETWLAHAKRKTARGLGYDPMMGRAFLDNSELNWINQYCAPVFEKTDKQDKLSVFFNHMEFLFPIEIEREWFISWMAFNIQYPEKRCKVTPLHISTVFGVGRGWIVELMQKLLGYWNCTKTKMGVLSGDGVGSGYNGYLNNSLLCLIEEVKESTKRYSVSDKIRDTLTENYLEVNIKFGANRTQRVFTNFFFMSNHVDALVIPRGDRRINVLTGPDEYKEMVYYNTLYDWLETDGVAQAYWWLKHRDLSAFNSMRSMGTPAKVRMIESNQSETEMLFWEMMEELPHPVMTQDHVVKYLQKQSGNEPSFGGFGRLN